MKRLQLLSYLLCTGIALHGAEQKPIESWKDIKRAEIEQTLRQDYISYLTNRLEEYKKTDFTPEDMNHMQHMSTIMTGQTHHGNVIYLQDIFDNKRNTFTHIAIRKRDLPMLKWLDCKKEGHYLSSGISVEDAKTPIDLCIDQLLPNAMQQNSTEIAHEMLDVLTAAYDTYSFSLECRKKLFTKNGLLTTRT